MASLAPAWAEDLAQTVAPVKLSSNPRPNIIVFLVDDLGWQDTSVAFGPHRTPLNDKFHTPAMERLAKQGMKFTQAYACNVCTPSRVSLLTGLHPARHRVTNWTLHKGSANDGNHPLLKMPPWNVNGLSPQSGTDRAVYAKPLPMFLREVGYRTVLVGKAHFGAIGTPGANPLNLGFDVNIGGHAAGQPGSYLGKDNYGDMPGLQAYHGTETFLTEALTIEANKSIDESVLKGKPFFLYMAHYAVHTPYAADIRFYQKYIDGGLEPTEAKYAALVEGMDRSLGDILNNVERHGLTEQTVVLFASDNGGLSAYGRGGTPHTHNLPLSSGKGSVREGGIRVPVLAVWPGVTPPGSTCDSPIVIHDFFPTILELAGMATPTPFADSQSASATDRPLNLVGIDGVSFVPLLRGDPPKESNRPLVWHYPNQWGPSGPGIGPSSTIRQSDWKLIYYHASGHYELFDLAQDLGERHDLATTEVETRNRLAKLLQKQLLWYDAQLPMIKSTNAIVALPGDRP